MLKKLSNVSGIPQKALEDTALKVIKTYKKSYKEEIEAGESESVALADAINKNKLLNQRIDNMIITDISNTIEAEYFGEFYEWLPSDANEPDPEHQLNYGEVFQIGKGEMPGQRYGCRCGMNILVKETKLDI